MYTNIVKREPNPNDPLNMRK